MEIGRALRRGRKSRSCFLNRRRLSGHGHTWNTMSEMLSEHLRWGSYLLEEISPRKGGFVLPPKPPGYWHVTSKVICLIRPKKYTNSGLRAHHFKTSESMCFCNIFLNKKICIKKKILLFFIFKRTTKGGVTRHNSVADTRRC